MSDKPAPKAGTGFDKCSSTARSDASRKPIYVNDPPAHAGIVAALRAAFGDGVRLPDNDDHDEFEELLARLN